MLLLSEDIRISHARIRSLRNDPEKVAAAARLVYVSDAQPGIARKKKGKKFIYLHGKRRITDLEELIRIKSLVIPPAWENVWICAQENGHLQATGIDMRQRKQYKYHPLWNSLRNHTKFYRLHEFGKALPEMRRRIDRDLDRKGLPVEKVLAAVVHLMETTSIRVGNEMYEKLYGSFGLTTFKDQHVKIDGHRLCFTFKGKKGISHNISVRSQRLAKIVKQCRDIPGKELFQYIDDEGNARCIDSGMVNDYIKEISGCEFSAKDFRTWTGSILAIKAFSSIVDDGETGKKKNIVNVIDQVAKHLGNTRTVCRKYYIHPLILTLYESDKLHKYLAQPLKQIKGGSKYELDLQERQLMRMLEKESMAA